MHAQVKDIMTTRVITVSKDTPYKEMAGLLRKHRISAFPVLDDDGTVIGVVSETDLLARQVADADRTRRLPALLHHKKLAQAGELTAADLMTSPAVTVSPGGTVRGAARLMYLHRIRRLPVTDAAGQLAGIISRADVLSVFRRPDDEIRREITQDVILDGFFIDPATFAVTVKDGIVTLEGSPGSAILGHGIAAQARHIEGVVAVRDRFTYPATVSGAARIQG